MKKSMIALVLAVVAPLSFAYGATGDTRVRSTNTYRRVTTTRRNPTTTNFYYNQSGQRKYSNARPVANTTTTTYRPVTNTVTSNRGYNDTVATDSYVSRTYNTERTQSDYSRKSYVSQERKYFLAHPFFQPLKGKFGSVTDISFGRASFGFDLLNATVYDIDPGSATYYPDYGAPIADAVSVNLSGKAETTQFLVKEDFSFGLTDRLAFMLMGQYDSTKIKLKDWSDGTEADTNRDSGLNVFGFGLQGRFVDTDDAIGMISAYYESQRDTADSLLAELKLGYKVDRTTLYLFGRGGYSWLKNKDSSYGVYLEDGTGDWLMLSYKRDVDDLFYAGGGIGLFSVLSKYFTVNAEAMFGNYDWHNQLTAKAAFGVQPFDSFAINIYASGVLYDSADGKIKQYLNYDVNPIDESTGTPLPTTLTYTVGDYKIKNYNEYKVGAQLILYF